MPSDQNAVLSLDRIALALAPFAKGAALSSTQLEQTQKYIELLLAWNRTVSLTAIDDPSEIVARHFGESIFAASLVPIQQGRLADVGTGAGFPGLPLKIVRSALDVILLEPNHRKCAFLNEVKRNLSLDVEVSRSRYEEYPVGPGSRFDFVCSRALGGYSKLLRWAETALTPSGKVVLWLGDEDSLTVGRTAGWAWEVPTRIPESTRRVIQVGRRVTG